MSTPAAVAEPTALDPLVEDMGIFIIPGRTYDPSEALDQSVEAERLGLRRVWLSERYDLKDAGSILGGAAALTTRLEVGTGIIACGSRHPLLTASLAATMQATYGHRFFLGLGRSSGPYLEGQGMDEFGYEAFGDYTDIVKALLRGETVTYAGPAGSFDGMRCVDPCPPPPPPVWLTSMGGPVASRVAARHADAVLLVPFLTVDAVRRAVSWVREEREKQGLDPAIRICHPIVVAAELDEDYTTAIAGARLLTYLVGMPVFIKAYLDRNGWDEAEMDRLMKHARFKAMDRATADQTYHREQIVDAAHEIPEAWIRETTAIGSVAECVETLQAYRDAGVDEIALYGSTPTDNADLIAAWRAAGRG